MVKVGCSCVRSAMGSCVFFGGARDASIQLCHPFATKPTFRVALYGDGDGRLSPNGGLGRAAMPQQIRAAICRSFGAPMSIEDVTLADPGPGAVVVEIKACAVCHSDITYADGGWGGDLPMVLGHEAAGIVEAVGPGVTRVAPGDRVVVTLVRSCGHCSSCSKDREFLCEETFDLDRNSPITDAGGAAIVHGMRTGAFAEKALVDESQLAPMPVHLGFEAASLLACGVVTGVGAAINTVTVEPGSCTVVIGCGGVGLNVVQGARIAGAESIIAIDVSDEKLDMARQLGATHVLNPVHDDAVDRVMALTCGRGADYAFVAAGAPPALESANAYIGRGGTVVIVGMPTSDVNIAYNPASFAGWGQRIVGSKMGSAKVMRDIPRLIDWHRNGMLELDALVTGLYGLDEINDAIEATRRGHGIRNVIVF